MDDLAGRDSGLDRVEEAQELLMPVALHPHDPTCSRSVLEPGMGGSGAPAPDQGNAPSPDSWAPLTLSLGPKPQLSAIFCPGGALQRTLWDGKTTCLGPRATRDIRIAVGAASATTRLGVPAGKRWIGPEMAPKIFLAHASEDKPQVRTLYARSKAQGFTHQPGRLTASLLLAASYTASSGAYAK